MPERPDRRRGIGGSPSAPLVVPKLIPHARQAANALLATVSVTGTARNVFQALLGLGLDDLDAGPQAGGYNEPSEAAWVAIENVVASYICDLERRVNLKHEDEATAVCQGSCAYSLRKYADHPATRRRSYPAN